MVDFNVTLQAHLQGPSQAEIRNVAAGIQRGLDGVGARISIDAGSSAASLGRVTAGADAARGALRQAREQAQLMNTSLSGTVSLGSQSAASLSNLAQQAGLAARRFVAMSVAAGVMVRIVQGFKDGVSAAVDFQVAMNKVQQVSGETADKVAGIQQTITQLATSLGVSSQGLAEAALIAKSAGLSFKETGDVLKTIALTNLEPQFGSMKETVNGVIAVMKQFKVQSQDLPNAFGGITAISSQFAIESKDLVEGIKKAGGAFAATGGTLQEFEGVMTAVRGTTRESAEEIATGLRTIFTRLQRSDTVAALKDLGINLRHTRQEAEALNDAKLENQFVGAYEAVKRLSQGLDALKTTDPRYAAVVEQLGGYRQISRVIPLLKNFEDAERAKNVAIAGGITLQAQAEQRADTLANKIDKVREQYLAAFRAIAETKGFQGMAEALARVASGLAKVLEYAAPLVPVLTALAAVRVAASIPSIVSNVSSAFNARVGAPLPPPVRRAAGGLIPGSGHDDTVPALLTPGEFVITKAAAQRVGVENLRALNEGGRARVERYAAGGLVGFRRYKGGDTVLPNLNDVQWDLVAKNMGLVEKAARRLELRGLGGVDPQNLAQESLYKAAANFDPDKGSFKALFTTILQRAVKDAANSKESRESFEGGIRDLPRAVDARAGVGSDRQAAVDVAIAREERAAFERAGGALIGSAQGKNNRGGINFEDLKAASQGLGIRTGGLTTEELFEHYADRIRGRILEQRATDAIRRQDAGFVGPPRPPGLPVAAPGAPEPDPRDGRLATLNALRRDGTRSLPLAGLGDLGLSKTATDALTSEARTVAAEAGKLADAMAGATNVVVAMRGGLAQVVGLKDTAPRSSLTPVPIGGPTLPVAGALASFGGVGAFPSPLSPVDVQAAVRRQQEEQARFAREARTRDLQREALEAAGAPDVYRRRAELQYQDVTIRDARLRQLREERATRQAVVDPYAERFGTQVGFFDAQRQRDEAFRNEQLFGPTPTLRQRAGGSIRTARDRFRATNDRIDQATGGRLGTGLFVTDLVAAPLIANLDREGKSTATRGAAGAVGGALTGATAGFAFGGPIGAAIGGVAGGLIGLTTSLENAANDINKAKINEALTGFADSLHSINAAMAGGGSASPGVLARNFDLLQQQRLNQAELNRREATHTFGGFDSEEFNRLQQESNRKNFAPQLPDVLQFLNLQAAQAGRAAPGGKVSDLAAQVLAGNSGQNRAFANLAADVRGLSPNDVRKEVEKAVASAQQAAKTESAQKAGRDAVELSTNAFGRLLLAVESADGSLDGLRARAQALGDAFDGAVSAVHVTGAERAGQLGRQDRGALAAFGAVAAATGEPGVQLHQSAVAVDDVARVLPGVLVQAASGRHGADHDVATEVSNGIYAALGIKDQAKAPPETQRAVNTVVSGIRTQVGGNQGEKPFGDAVALDVTKEAERLLAPLADPLKDFGAKIAEKLQENANKFIDGLATLARRTEQVGQAQDTAAGLGVGAFRTELQVRAARAGRANQALDFASLADLEKGQTARQERLAGVRGPAAFDVGDLARRLAEVQGRIPAAIDRQQEVAQRTGGRGPEFQAAAKALSDLQSQSSRLQAALKSLADVTTRTAEVQEKLNRAQQDKEGRRGLVERFLTADSDQAVELNRGLALAHQAANQGNFNGFLPADVRSALDFLKSAGGATLKGFPGAPRADDLVNKLLENSAGGIAKPGADEKALQDELVKRTADAAKAQEEFAKSLQRSSTEYFNNLTSQQQQFFTRLVEEVKTIHLADQTNRAGAKGVEAKEAAGLADQKKTLTDLGFTTGGQVRQNADALVKYAEATREILSGKAASRGADQIFADKFKGGVSQEQFLTDNFQQLNKEARDRVLHRADALSAAGEAALRPAGTIGPFQPDPVRVGQVRRESFLAAIKDELAGNSPGSEYNKAVGRQTEAFHALEGVKGLDFNKVNGIAGDPAKLDGLLKAIEAFRDGKKFDEDLAKKAIDLKKDFESLSAAVQRAEQAIAGLQQGRVRAIATAAGNAAGSVASGFAAGGSIFRPRGSDTVPAMLTPGEFVVNRASATANRALLEHINGARGPVYKADGGLIGLFKRAAGGVVDGVKEAGRTVADAAGYGPEGRKKEELDRKLAEANKDRPQYRADGGPLFSPEEAERRRRAFEDPNSVVGFVPSAVPGVRPVDDVETPPAPGRAGLRTPRDFDPEAYLPDDVRRAMLTRRGEAAYPVDADRADSNAGPNQGRAGEAAYPDGRRGSERPHFDDAGSDATLRFARALAAAQGRTLSPDEEARAARNGFNGLSRSGQVGPPAPGKPVGPAPAPKVGQLGGLPADLRDELAFQAALNPYGQSALLLAGQTGGPRAAARLAFAGQVDAFNRRSYAANYSHNAIAEASALSHQRYTSEAYRRYKEAQGVKPPAGWGYLNGVRSWFGMEGQLAPFAGDIYPKRFATGGMVPGMGNHDSVPSLLTPGEFVLRQSAVQKLGVANAQALNSGGPVKYYADGGGVSGSSGDGGAAALAQAAAAFNQSAQQMAQAFTVFSGPAQALAKAMESMPRTLNVTGQHTVQVNMNGAEALSRLEPAFKEMVTDSIRKELSRLFKDQAPDLGVQVG